MSSRTRLPWVGVAAKHSVLWDRSLSMLDGRDHSSHSICPGKYRIQKFGSTQKNEMWRGWRNVWNNILIAECEMYNCCHHLRGLRTGDRAKLDNPEASSYPNESSCLSHSTEFNLCPLLLLPFLSMPLFPSLTITPSVGLTCMQSCSTPQTAAHSSASSTSALCWQPVHFNAFCIHSAAHAMFHLVPWRYWDMRNSLSSIL